MIGSLAVTLTVIPALGSADKRKPEGSRQPGLFAVLADIMPILLAGDERPMDFHCGSRWPSGRGFAVLPMIGTEFLPPLDEGALAINVVRLPTASVEGSAVQCTEIEKRLLAKFPGGHVGRLQDRPGRDFRRPDGARAERPADHAQAQGPVVRALTKEKLVREIQLELGHSPGIRPAFSQPIALRVNELLSGIKSDVAIKVIGDDMDRLRETGEKIAPILAAIEGAEDVKIEQVSGFTQWRCEHKREAMARHKINAEDINSLIETAVGGKVATRCFEGQRRFDVLVRFPEDKRNTPTGSAR